MGLSFVSKVAPPKMKGVMQGGWLGATAIGNYLAGYIGGFYQNWELWQFFLFVGAMALVSALLVAIVLKKLNRAISS
jgi:POT family proton-dependent oligopeptide transporter